jgi:hypothetical protein
MRSQPQFLDELRARLPASEVVGKRVRLKKVGREWKGLSPFNKERTPSLFVSDEKGLYHDFSMGEARGHLYLHDGDGRSDLSGSGGTAGRSCRPCDATVTAAFTPLHANAPLLQRERPSILMAMRTNTGPEGPVLPPPPKCVRRPVASAAGWRT